MDLLYIRNNREHPEPQSGGRKMAQGGADCGTLGRILSRKAAAGALAQGGAEGGTLGTESNQVEPCKGDRNAFAPIFMAVSWIRGFMERTVPTFRRPRFSYRFSWPTMPLATGASITWGPRAEWISC